MDENQSVCHVCNQKFPTFELEMHFLECQMQDDNGNQQSESYTPGSELMPDQSYASNYVQTLQDVASVNFVNTDHDNQTNIQIIENGFQIENGNDDQSATQTQIIEKTAFTCKFCGKSFKKGKILKVSLFCNFFCNLIKCLIY